MHRRRATQGHPTGKRLLAVAKLTDPARWRNPLRDARQWYDRALWMEKNKPTDEEHVRFKAEAAELLGLDKKRH